MSLVVQPLLELFVRDLNIWRYRQWILSDVRFRLPAGSFVVLCGRNGAGKSTLLRAVAELLEADDGWCLRGDCEFVFAGGSAPIVTGRRQAVSYVSQSLSPVEDLTVREFLGLSTRSLRTVSRAVSLSQLFGLEDLELRLLSQLSGGQWQRVRLVQALMQNASVLILDEPDSYLDAHWRAVLYAQLAALAQEGCLVMLSLHRPGEAARWATHVMGLEAGRLMFCEPFQSPAAGILVERLFLGKRLDSPERVV